MICDKLIEAFIILLIKKHQALQEKKSKKINRIIPNLSAFNS